MRQSTQILSRVEANLGVGHMCDSDQSVDFSEQENDNDETFLDVVDYQDDDSVPTAARWPAFRGSSKDYWDESSSSDEEDLFR